MTHWGQPDWTGLEIWFMGLGITILVMLLAEYVRERRTGRR